MTGPGRRSGVLTLFAVYLGLLVWVVLWKLEVPWTGDDRTLKLVPFVATPTAGASAPLEVAANVALLVPLGVYLGMLTPPGRGWPATARVAGAAALLSTGLEVTQYVLGVGRTDTSDVVANTAGGLLGLVLLTGARRSLGRRASAVAPRFCAAATASAVLAVALYLASPWRAIHVHDVGPLAVPGQSAYSTSTGAWSLQRSP